MTNVLLPTSRSVIVAGTPMLASMAVGVSAELAMHHLGEHACPATGHWHVAHVGCVECSPDGPSAQVVACEICGEPLAVIAEDQCAHFPELLDSLEAGVIP